MGRDAKFDELDCKAFSAQLFKCLSSNTLTLFYPALEKNCERISESVFLKNVSLKSLQAILAHLHAHPERAQHFAKNILCSEFIVDYACRNAAYFIDMLEADYLYQPNSKKAYQKKLQDLQLADCSEPELMKAIRVFRQCEMLKIIWRDLSREVGFEKTVQDVSDLAATIMDAVLDVLYLQQVQQCGQPIGQESGQPQHLVILGMGKLGAGELNISSDIDLIFTYPEAGETAGKEKRISNQEFFSRLCKTFIRMIDSRTADGMVFRVDMRLRPNGSGGPLVLNFSAMEDYYQKHGREWERYAFIKCSVVAGDVQQGSRLLAQLNPFIYRRYIDFGVIQSLREMKALIERQVKRQNLSHNIKIGAGGIREIEFIVQSFQLIYGGKDKAFQQRSLLTMLDVLHQNNLLNGDESNALRGAYIYLRNLEHVLQGWRDEQTQLLPGDDAALLRVAYAMLDEACVASTRAEHLIEAFQARCQGHRAFVQSVFADVIAAPDTAPDASNKKENEIADICVTDEGSTVDCAGREKEVYDFWCYQWQLDEAQAPLDEDDIPNAIKQTVSKALLDVVNRFKTQKKLSAMDKVSRQRLDRFMPLFLTMLSQYSEADFVFERVLPLIESVLRRSAYIVLLTENSKALEQVIVLCKESQFFARQLVQYPMLLDELLDVDVLYRVPSMEELADELHQQLLRVPVGDLEATMNTLRHFKLAHSLRIYACEISGLVPIMKVSDYLSWVAEVILQAVLDLAWADMVEKHGVPVNVDGQPCDKDFIIVAYGKLGGLELGPSSDLDLVFIHDAKDNTKTQGGHTQSSHVDSGVFFHRLGQRIIHFLTAKTASGELYEIDMRLRPSGASGLLVSSFKAFERYQYEKAWVWEHQALVRARVVAGDKKLAERFGQLRRDVLIQSRDRSELAAEVVKMRNKMREHLDKPKNTGSKQDGDFNLKQGKGGIVDIEFIVQYLVLAEANVQADLAVWSDNIRILDTLKSSSVLPEQAANQMAAAYKYYRTLVHQKALRDEEPSVEQSTLDEHRNNILNIWQLVFNE